MPEGVGVSAILGANNSGQGDTMAEALTKTVKKVIHWGKGLAVFITREAKQFKWTDKTYVTVTAIRDKEGERIIIKKVRID